MPARPQPPAMTPDEFRARMEAAGLTERTAAEALGVNKNTVYRWLSGETPIAADKAALIRQRIRPEGE
jgi:transcriptional regulator with XRE-family HTH domain